MALLKVLLSLLVCFYIPSSLAAILPSKPHALFLKVTKDLSTSQYITEIKQRTPLVPVKLTIDLGSDQVWVFSKGYISSTYKPVHCKSSLCKSIEPHLDCHFCQVTPQPGCYNNSCSTFFTNTVSRFSGGGEAGKDSFSIQSTDGSNPGEYINFPRLVLTSSLTDIRIGLANGVDGMAGFSKSPISLSSQLSHASRFPRIWALCLGSSSGFAVIGDGPYNVLPGIDLSQSLTYTPLVSSPSDWNTFRYYIGVTGIKVDNKFVPVNTTLLKINENGNQGTTISTVVPYTIMESSIYKAVTNAFVNALSKVPRVKPVAPFEVCYKSSSFPSTLLGPGVPAIELVLHREDVSWKIFGLNSMVLVKGKTLCLGFEDGGVNLETSIVIGAYQLQNAFMKFDLSRSRLGFASTIIGRKTTCSNFNFTSNVV